MYSYVQLGSMLVYGCTHSSEADWRWLTINLIDDQLGPLAPARELPAIMSEACDVKYHLVPFSVWGHDVRH